MDKDILIIFIFIIPVIHSLKNVQVVIPPAVKKQDDVVLRCFYDMEDDFLYSIKWYKGRREFYRYSPKEVPAMKMFQVPGINIKDSASNESQITLTKVTSVTSGKYSCEVSADAPSFHTIIASGDLEVVEVPESRPVIHGIKPRYKPGEILRGNCTSKYSKPAANLTWTINDITANPSYVRLHKPIKNPKFDTEISMLGIHFVVSNQHFHQGKLKIKCIARIHDIYQQSTERSIEEDRQRVTDTTSSSQNNIFLGFPIYIDSNENEVGDKKGLRDSYMTQLQGDVPSINKSPISKATLTVVMIGLCLSTIIKKWPDFYVVNSQI